MADTTGEGTESLKDLASLLNIVAHPVRLMILENLLSGVKCVKDLNDLIPISQPNLSQHMSALREAGLVDSLKIGETRKKSKTKPRSLEAALKSSLKVKTLKQMNEATIQSLKSIQRKLDVEAWS